MPATSYTESEDNKENNCSWKIKDQKGKKEFLIKV